MRRSRLIALVVFAACLQAAAVAGPFVFMAVVARAARRARVGPARPVGIAVHVTCAGLDAEQCEREIAVPLERRLAGIAGVERIRSDSVDGAATVVVEWPSGADPERGLAEVHAALEDERRSWPREADPPVVMRVSRGAKLRYTIESDRLSLVELRALQDWQVRPALLSVPGVRDVETFGGREREIEAILDFDRLAALGLDAAAVVSALRSSALELPAGALRAGDRELSIRAAGQGGGVEDLATAVVAQRDGVPIRVRDVAVVHDGAAPVRTLALRTGRREVVAGVIALDRADGDASSAVRSRLAEIATQLPPSVTIRPFDEHEDATVRLAVDLPHGLSSAGRAELAQSVFGEASGPSGREALGLLGPRGFELAVRVPSLAAARGAILDFSRHVSGWRTLSGTAGARPFDVRLAGADRSILEDLAARAGRALGATPGVIGVAMLGVERMPRRVVHLDRARAADMGVSLADATTALAVAEDGVEATTWSGSRERVPVVVRAAPSIDLDRIRVRRAGGGSVPLADLGSIVSEAAPARLLREDGRPVVVVCLSALEDDVASFKEALAREVPIPAGYTLTCAPASDDE